MSWARPWLRAVNRTLLTPGVCRRLLRGATVVFLYHEVSDTPSRFNRFFGLNVPPAAFSRQMELIRGFFHLIDPVGLIRGDYPRPAALITFDDGNLSFFRNAVPLLKEKGIPSVAFLNLGPIRGEICWSGLVTYLQQFEPGFFEKRDPRPRGNDFTRFSELEVNRYLDAVGPEDLLERVRSFRGPLATEEDLQEASKEPLVFFGNHSYNHFNATLLSDRLREAFWRNQEILDGLPRGRRLWSYPFSCYNDETGQSLRREGAEALFVGGGLPNFHRGGKAFYRVELEETVATEGEMFFSILKRLLPAACRGEVCP